MTELARFRPAAAKLQPTFVFERASLALVATWRVRLAAPGTAALSLDSEWRDPVACRLAF
jgi:hypothetical protein